MEASVDCKQIETSIGTGNPPIGRDGFVSAVATCRCMVPPAMSYLQPFATVGDIVELKVESKLL